MTHLQSQPRARWGEIPTSTPPPLPILMGILNVTPDSFSDAGRHQALEHAIEHAMRLADEGAHVIDVGGESTRPGAQRVDAAEQVRRTEPVIRALRDRLAPDVAISIDTTLADVAERALDAGASIINDVAAGTEDPAILALASDRKCGLVLMHRLRAPDEDRFSDRYDERNRPVYADVVDEVGRFLSERVQQAVGAGVDASRIVVDPGLGFGKTVEQNLTLLARTRELIDRVGRPVLSGLSRKSFVGAVSGVAPDAPPALRSPGTIALSVLHVQRGASVLRVHEPGPIRQAIAAARACEACDGA